MGPAKSRSRLEVAEWGKVTRTIVTSIKDGVELYARQYEEHEHEMAFNSANVIAIVSEVRYTQGTVAVWRIRDRFLGL